MSKFLHTNINDFLYESVNKNNIFIKKFEDSKVVDNNKPLLMYHGGSYSNGEFKGIGWFTTSKSTAKYYAKQNDGIVTIAYLIIKNPLYSGDIYHLKMKATDDMLKSINKRNLEHSIKYDKNNIIKYLETNAATLIAQDIKCDGVIDISDKKIIDAVIFSNKQILLASDYK